MKYYFLVWMLTFIYRLVPTSQQTSKDFLGINRIMENMRLIYGRNFTSFTVHDAHVTHASSTNGSPPSLSV